MSEIEKNIELVKKKIKEAALRAGRNPATVKLVAVTKTVRPDRILEAVNAGITDVGENRVQELVEKKNLTGDVCNWHMVGHLQRNKVKHIIDTVSLYHSVDSIELAEEIGKRAERLGKTAEILMQVNVAGEKSKYGFRPEEVEDAARNISHIKGIKTRGLMTIAPYVDNPEQIRGVFRELKRLSIDICGKNIDNIYMDYLSMGMSGDFEIAIEEGASIVRIGSLIFGKRL